MGEERSAVRSGGGRGGTRGGAGRCARGRVGSRLLLVQRQQLLPVDGYVAGSFDTESNLAAINVHHGNADVVPDETLLAQLAAENEHGRVPPVCITRP